MRSAIDSAGRVIIPKALRDDLGLRPGTPLEVRERGGALVLEPLPVAARLVRRGKGLVVVPEEELPPLTTEQVREALEASRK